MLIGDVLDDGGRGLGQALVLVALGLLVVLLIAVCVPVAVVTGMAHSGLDLMAGGIGVPAPPLQPGGPPAPPEVRPPTPPEADAVDMARRYLGVPYVFGGTNPATGLDCSGLVQLVFRQLGIQLPRTAQQQYDATARIPADQVQPGDLVFFARTYADPHDWVTHVGIYLGNGQQINAPTEGQVVSIQPVFTGFWGAHFIGGGRVSRR